MAAGPWTQYQPQPAAPPSGPAPAAGPWTQYQQQPGATPDQTDQPDNRPLMDRIKDFAKYGPGDSDNPVVQSVHDFAQGAGSSASEIPAMIGGVLHRIGGNLIGDSDPITAAFKQQAATPRDTTSAKAGALFETMAEWMVGEGELKALTQGERMAKLAPVVKMLEKYPKLSEAAIAHPEIVKYLPDAMRQGILGASQTVAHGDPNDLTGTATNAVEAGGAAGALGLALPMVTGGILGKAAGIAEKVKPTVRELEGATFTQLANEVRGPSGEIIAPKVAQKAAQYGSERLIREERQRAFAEMQTNLAKKGIGNALADANEAQASSAVGPNVQATAGAPGAQGNAWRYIPPDGSASLTAEQTRSAMNELKQQWLGKEWGPGQDEQLKQAYNDMQEQLGRNDAYSAAQPVAPHDVESAVQGVNSYGDAAAHLNMVARQQMADLSPTIRSQYLDLANERKGLQDAFDEVRDNPNQRQIVMEKLDDVNQRLEGLLGSSEALTDSPGAAAQAFKTQRLANGFQKLQNTMDQHFNLRADTAEAISRPRTATKLNSLADHIEQVKQQYGDVLNPVLGDQGLNHITELGDLLNQPKLADAPKTFMQNAAAVLKKHIAGGRGIVAASPLAAMAYTAGHVLGGIKLGTAAVGGEAAYRMVVNRMATDPAFAERIIEASRNNAMPKVAGPLLASMMVTAGRNDKDEEQDQ